MTLQQLQTFYNKGMVTHAVYERERKEIEARAYMESMCALLALSGGQKK